MGEKLEKFSGTDKFGFREFKNFENFQHLYKWDERQRKHKLIRDRLVSRKLIDQIPYGSLKTHIEVNHTKECENICSLILEWPALVGKDHEVQGEKKTDQKHAKYIKHLEGKVEKLEEDIKSLPCSYHAVMQNQPRNEVYTPKCTKSVNVILVVMLVLNVHFQIECVTTVNTCVT